MNVLHINQSDTGGGAGIAAYRLHQGLLNQGIDSKLLVGIRQTDDPRVARVPRRNYPLTGLLKNMTDAMGLNYVSHLATWKIPSHKFYQEADILNFHNLHSGYFNYLFLPHLTRNKPAIYALHDMWSFTGHCAYSFDCNRWQVGCGQCPYPDTYPTIKRDNTELEWKLKKWVYKQANLTIVTPSHWLASQVKLSILEKYPTYCIPHGIDINIYIPLDQLECRRCLRIEQYQYILVTSALNLQDPRKGTDLLIKAINALSDALKRDILILVMGDGGKNLKTQLDCDVLPLGYINLDQLKVMVFSAADLFIFPTRGDIFGLVAQEAMACGTPTVAFNVGGVPDLVRPGITGELAEPENPQDLARKIEQLLVGSEARCKMSQNCREIAVKEYNLTLQAQRYIDLYQQVLADFRG
ncbi:glycosyl transferase, group 1 [Gloeomargarita lithophora Alchichica-D10]|uniref:Glycosyl transferase, group 1 n=1 Tax=Gloeomargarita lithophora Alchichica-D10 TaxID=1188229 RepID=A0A1J0AFT7_9CYAN|nr:glycosyltransferase family 4 protein [Gloeomargarita lithophora]APB34783.1 glycosyl transferase, group 1 [Gloeomargarita lithophora Alchichica-D10]